MLTAMMQPISKTLADLCATFWPPAQASSVSGYARRTRPWLTAVIASSVLALLVGCTPQSADDDDDDSDADDEAVTERIDYGHVAQTPYIHVRQTVVAEQIYGKQALENRRQVLEEYQQFCMSSGGAQSLNGSKPLYEAAFGKAGHTYYEAWYKGPKMAVRADTWDFGEDLCKPLRHESKLRIVSPEGTWDIDLGEGTGQFEAGADYVRPMLFDPDGTTHAWLPELSKPNEQLPLWPREFREEALRSEEMLLSPVPVADGTRRVAGQTCDAYHYGNSNSAIPELAFTDCYWNAGRDWAFADVDPVESGIEAYSQGILLARQPVDEATYAGQTLTTDEMTVGVPFDEKVFAVPEGIAITSYQDDDGTDDDQLADIEDADDDDNSEDDNSEDDNSEDDNDDDAKPLTLDDLRKLSKTNVTDVFDCSLMAAVIPSYAIPFGYISAESKSKIVPVSNLPKLARDTGDNLDDLILTLPERLPLEALRIMAREIRAQAARDPIDRTPAMSQANSEIIAWIKKHCSKEALNIEGLPIDTYLEQLDDNATAH